MLYLASKSPRRRKLLKLLNIPFKSFTVDVEELLLDGEHPVKTVKRLSELKMQSAHKKIKDGIIITADTIVVLNKLVLGKPKDEKDAIKMLAMLSGKTHTVYTGFTIFNKAINRKITDYEKTKVSFRNLDMDEIAQYVKSGSPLDKAGSYGIQDDYGALFVSRIDGCYYNVVGLPIAKLNSTLKLVM